MPHICGLCGYEYQAKQYALNQILKQAKEDAERTGKTYAVCESQGQFLHVEYDYALENEMSISQVVSRLSPST